MTQPIDTVSVEIVPDFDQFGVELRQELNRITRAIERTLGRAFDRMTRDANDAGNAIGREIAQGGERAEDALRDLGNVGERQLDRIEREADDASRAVLGLDAALATVNDELQDLSADLDVEFERSFRRFSASFDDFDRRTRPRTVRALREIADSAGDLTSTLVRFARTIGTPVVSDITDLINSLRLTTVTISILVVEALPALIGLIVSLGAVVTDAAGVLALLPGFLAAIGAVIAPLVIGFIGFGDAIEAVIDGDPEKITEALEGLAPAARSVVGEFQRLLPALREIGDVVQQQLFAPLIGDLTQVFSIVRGPLLGGLANVAASLGSIVSDFADFLGEPATVEAFAAVFATVGEILEAMRPGIRAFSAGIRDIVVASLPFIEQFSGFIAGILEDFGAFLTEATQTGDFDAFMTSALQSLRSIGELLQAAVGFFDALFTPETIAAGQLILIVLTDLINTITGFLQTTAGQRFLEDLGVLAVVATGAIANLVLVLGFLFASITLFIGEIVRLFTSADEAIDTLKNATREGAEELVGFIERVPQTLVGFAGSFASAGTRIMQSFFNAVRDRTDQLLNFARGIPGRVIDAIGNLGSLLFRAGQNVIQGLINGIRSMLNALRSAARDAASSIRNFLPFSPAREGPLSGTGDPTLAGGAIARMIAEGMLDELSSIRAAASLVASAVLPEPSAATAATSTTTDQTVRATQTALGVPGTVRDEQIIVVMIGNEQIDAHIDRRVDQRLVVTARDLAFGTREI